MPFKLPVIERDGKTFRECKTCKNEFELNEDNFYKHTKNSKGVYCYKSKCKKCWCKIPRVVDKNKAREYSRIYMREYRRKKKLELNNQKTPPVSLNLPGFQREGFPLTN